MHGKRESEGSRLTNIASAQIWPTSSNVRMSIEELIMDDSEDLFVNPAIGYLLPMFMELLSSILQVVVDRCWSQGLSYESYSLLLRSGTVEGVRAILEPICGDLRKGKGFALSGVGSVMQMPSAWRQYASIKPVSDLFWPFQAKEGGGENGLRCKVQVPIYLGVDLTAVLLFSHQMLSRGIGQYWSAGKSVNSVYVQRLHGTTMRQRLFSLVLPNFSKYWRGMQSLWWLPKCHNNGGLEVDGSPLFLKYLLSKGKIKGTANIRFQISRAIILDSPSKGICDVTGDVTDVYTSFGIISERNLYKLIEKILPQKKKLMLPPMAGIVGSMFGSKQKHPSHASCENGKVIRRTYWQPKWSLVGSEFTSPVVDVVRQVVRGDNRERVYDFSLFSLAYEPKVEIVVRDIMCRQYTVLMGDLSRAISANIINQLVVTKAGIYSLIKNILLAAYCQQDGKLNRIEYEFVNQLLADAVQNLWTTADELYFRCYGCNDVPSRLMVESVFFEAKKHWWKKASQQLETKGLWGSSIGVEMCNLLNEDIRMENPVPSQRVVAGREFAHTYGQLLRVDQCRIRNACRFGNVFAVSAFWSCYRKIMRKWPQAYSPLLERVVIMLEYIVPVETNESVGCFLLRVSENVRSQKIEELFVVGQFDVVLLLEKLLIQVKANVGKIECDFGVLLRDLSDMHFDEDRVHRKWAIDYYLNKKDL